MKQVLYFMCDIEDEVRLTEDERDMYDIAVQCVAAVMNRMIPGCEDRPLVWDEEDYQSEGD